MGMRCLTFPIPFIRPLLVLAACALFLSAGCASKTVIQSVPSPSPVQQPARQPAVTETLLARYEAWKGVPHRIGGTDHRGVDCSGLMQIVFREAFDMELPRTSREQSRLGQNVPPADMRPGDLVYFIDKRGDHIGVVVERGRFLHASATVGVTVSQFDAYWWPRLKRVQRVLPPSLTAAQSGF
ncbi:hypothetical protein JCM14713_03300 [Desulfomicrobium salsuginis]